MLDSMQFNNLYGNSKTKGSDLIYRTTTSLVPSEDKSLKNKQTEDEEFYRIMELIKTEKSDQYEYAKPPEPEESPTETEEISHFMLCTLMITLLTCRIIQGFQNIITRVKELFDQSFPYIWTWMKSITRGTYSVADGKVGLFLLCVPLLTLVLFLYCSLLTFNAVTDLLLSNPPTYISQMIVTDKFTKLVTRPKI